MTMNGFVANGTTAPLETPANELARAMRVKTNDQLMSIYLSSLIRAITAFHDLIENKIQNKQRHDDENKEEETGDDKEKAKQKEGEKDKEDKNAKPKSQQEAANKEGWKK